MTSRMREIRQSGSVGARGEQSPWATRPFSPRLIGDPKIVGERKNHVQLRVKQGDVIIKALAWNMADRCKSLKADTMCSLAFQPSINEWNGRRDVQLEVKDFHLEGAESGGNSLIPA